MYLAIVIELYPRLVISWSMSQQLVCDALMMALWRREFPRGVLFHLSKNA